MFSSESIRVRAFKDVHASMDQAGWLVNARPARYAAVQVLRWLDGTGGTAGTSCFGRREIFG